MSKNLYSGIIYKITHSQMPTECYIGQTKLTLKKRIPAFRPGDTLKVTLKIVEGEKSRLQVYEGVCIARKNNSVNSKFTVRKMSHGEGVERVFPLFSPNIDKIEVVRKGNVKRAKLYYLRDRTGKSARIADRDRGDEADQYELIENVEAPAEAAPAEAAPAEAAPAEAAVKKKPESSASKAENTENESK